MKSAKKMFKKLDYKIIVNDKNQLTYEIVIWIDDFETIEKTITFFDLFFVFLLFFLFCAIFSLTYNIILFCF